jgi:hypothetical protein
MTAVTARSPAGQSDWSDPVILLRCKHKTTCGTGKCRSPLVGAPPRCDDTWMSAAYALHINGICEVREELAVVGEAAGWGHFCCLTLEPSGAEGIQLGRPVIGSRRGQRQLRLHAETRIAPEVLAHVRLNWGMAAARPSRNTTQPNARVGAPARQGKLSVSAVTTDHAAG